MDLAEAMQIVLDLAHQGQMSEHDAMECQELSDEYDRQQKALNQVTDFAVNHLGNN